MVGDQDADAAFLEELMMRLNVEHGDRVDAGERLVEQDKSRLGGEGARDLEAAALAARERDRGVLAQCEMLRSLSSSARRGSISRARVLQLEDRLHVFFHREAAEHRILLRQIGDAQPAPGGGSAGA